MVIYVEFRFRPDGQVLLSEDKDKLEKEVARLKRELAIKRLSEAASKLTF